MTTPLGIHRPQELPWMDEFFDRLPIRILLLTLTVALAGALLSLLFSFNMLAPPWLMRWFVLTIMGVLAGLAARVLVPKHAALLRWVSALVGLSAGLWATGWITQGYVGFPPRLGVSLEEGLRGAAHLLLTGAVAWLAVRVWRPSNLQVKTAKKERTKPTPKVRQKTKSRTKIATPEDVKSTTKGDRKGTSQRKPGGKKMSSGGRRQTLIPSGKGNRASKRKTTLLPQASLKISNLRKGVSAGWGRMSIKARDWWDKGRGSVIRLASKVPSGLKISQVHPSSRPTRVTAPKRQDHNVQLVGEVEHRCPYCLDPVDKGDPRGVRVCPICQTHHHADCWAVTGMCQVPHMNKG